MDRGSTFDDAELAQLLSERFVPVALDVWYEQRRQDEAGEFYRRVVLQREGASLERTTQGFYAFEADGDLLRAWNRRGGEFARTQLAGALEDYVPVQHAGEEGALDERYVRRLPEGGLVLDVHARVLQADWPPARDRWDPLRRTSVGRDHLWVLPAEVDDLGRGRVPASWLRRLARFHLVDNTRGEPPMWAAAEVRALQLERGEDGWWRGRAQLLSEDGTRGYEAELLMRLVREGDRLRELELVALGAYHGEGRWTQGAPPGEFELGVLVRVGGRDEASQLALGVPPQGARNLADYWGDAPR